MTGAADERLWREWVRKEPQCQFHHRGSEHPVPELHQHSQRLRPVFCNRLETDVGHSDIFGFGLQARVLKNPELLNKKQGDNNRKRTDLVYVSDVAQRVSYVDPLQPQFTLDGSAPRPPLDQMGGWRMGDSGAYTFDDSAAPNHGPRPPLDQMGGWRMGDTGPLSLTENTAPPAGGRGMPRNPRTGRRSHNELQPHYDGTILSMQNAFSTMAQRSIGAAPCMPTGAGNVIEERAGERAASPPRRSKDTEIFDASHRPPIHPCSEAGMNLHLPHYGIIATDLRGVGWEGSRGAVPAPDADFRRKQTNLKTDTAPVRHDPNWVPPKPTRREFGGPSKPPRAYEAGNGKFAARSTDVTSLERSSQGDRLPSPTRWGGASPEMQPVDTAVYGRDTSDIHPSVDVHRLGLKRAQRRMLNGDAGLQSPSLPPLSSSPSPERRRAKVLRYNGSRPSFLNHSASVEAELLCPTRRKAHFETGS